MTLPPAVIVHGLDDVRAVLGNGRPVTLLSAPAAACYAGCGWWLGLMGQARALFPEARFDDVLDCGDAAGQALAALRAGQRLLVLSAAAPGWDAVAAIAAARAARVLAEAPDALDMADQKARRRLHEWLRLRTTPGDSGRVVG